MTIDRARRARRLVRIDLPEPRALPPGDADRAFGRFTWGAYSPAGGLERNGFFWRQLRRRRSRDGWKIVGYMLWVILAVPLLVGLVFLPNAVQRASAGVPALMEPRAMAHR